MPYHSEHTTVDSIATEVEIKNAVGSPVPVSAISFPLPTGAATEATLASILASVDGLEGFTDGLESLIGTTNSSLTTLGTFVDGLEGFTDGIETKLDTLNAKDFATQTTLASIDTRLAGTIAVSGPLTDAQLRALAVPVSGTFFQATQPVSVASLPLPTGASTSAKQDTGNTSLSSIDGKTATLVSGRVPVDGSGVTQPVSGPLTDAQLRALAVPVSNASLPLPAGASTSAAQTTGNSSLSSIDGNLTFVANSTHLEDDPHASGDRGLLVLAIRNDVQAALTNTDGDYSGISVDNVGRVFIRGGQVEDAAAASGAPGLFMLAVRNDANAVVTSTDGDYSQVSVDSAGRIKNIVSDGADAAEGSTTDAEAVGNGSVIAILKRLRTLLNGGLPAALGTGGGLKVDGSGTALPVSITGTVTTSDTSTLVDNATFTDGTTRVAMQGYIFDETAGTALTENDAAAARVDSKRAQIHVLEDGTTRGTRQAVKAASTAAVAADPSAVVALSPNSPIPTGTNTIGSMSSVPVTSGGLSIYENINLINTGVEIKASAGQVYGWYIFNAATTTRYVKLYNTYAGATPASTDTPSIVLPIPAGGAANVQFGMGIAFGTKIGIRATTGVANADNTAPTANDVIVNIFYK